ncbi:MAG: hypothetical protein R3F37_11170 [Candidatus Competibacteraceae bacterium]
MFVRPASNGNAIGTVTTCADNLIEFPTEPTFIAMRSSMVFGARVRVRLWHRKYASSLI